MHFRTTKYQRRNNIKVKRMISKCNMAYQPFNYFLTYLGEEDYNTWLINWNYKMYSGVPNTHLLLVQKLSFIVYIFFSLQVHITSYECDLHPSECTIGALSIEEGNSTYHLSDTAKPILTDNPVSIHFNFLF